MESMKLLFNVQSSIRKQFQLIIARSKLRALEILFLRLHFGKNARLKRQLRAPLKKLKLEQPGSKGIGFLMTTKNFKSSKK